MEKIDLKNLGYEVCEYKDGKPFTDRFSPNKAVKEIAEKINEIVEFITNPPVQE
jgi:hypothetical protein